MGVCGVIFILFLSPFVFTFPDQGQWTKSFEKAKSDYFGVHKTLYSGSSISVSVNCEPFHAKEKVLINIGWSLRQTSCYEEYLENDILNPATLKLFYDCPMNPTGTEKIRFMQKKLTNIECSSFIHLEFTNASFLPGANPSDLSTSTCYEIESLTPKSTSLLEPNSSKVMKNKDFKDEDYENKSFLGTRKKRANNIQNVELSNENATIPADSDPVENSKFKKKVDSLHDKIPTPKNSSNEELLYQDVHTNVKKTGSKLTTVDMDGVYLFILKFESTTEESVNITIDISMKGDYGYLSAVDYPLLLFYGYMCAVYVLYSFSWLVVSAMQWRDLLRIQFWIGAVIVLGLSEKAVFYAEYQSINYTGQSVQGAVMFAEILSCLKRTLARMLVIIVSLGFGIVKPRLGPMLHRVVGVGALYFVLGTTEGCLRVLKPKNDPSNQALMAGIPLAVTDSVICWWIFSSLVQTNRTLRLRRNLVKLSLYRHFTNTLIFAVLASVAYMFWSIHSHKLVTCVQDWKELWVDEAYWHLLFSLLLLVIMILWRPTNNNQRYAYTPLLDALDDENEDEFDQSLSNDAFVGMKMRSSKNSSVVSEKDVEEKQDDDLKWVEENVPSTFTENAVPSFLDSDEEIMTAKFERNKME